MSHFNEAAAQWDEEDKIKMMQQLAEKTLEKLNITKPIDILDFGCGTGLFGLEMAPIAKSITGIDTSEGMLEIFNKKTQNASHIKSVLIDLEKQNYDKKFDLIVSSMAFHHLEDPNKMITKLKSMLNPLGHIAIVDLDKEDGTFHPDNKAMGVRHFGFDQDELSQWAKLNELTLDHHIINFISKNQKEYGQFLAIFH